MNIKILKDNVESQMGQISFDKNGNVYIDVNNSTYQINVDRNHKPYCDKGNYEIKKLETQPKIGKLVPTNSKYSLKGKTIQKIEKDKQELLDDELDNENENNQENHERIYFHEDSQYFEDIELDPNEDDDEEMNEYFSFSSNNMEIPINERENGDILALYDTLIFNDERICLKTKLLLGSDDIVPLYRLQMYASGKCFFRPIGDKDTQYYLKINQNDELLFMAS
ncbi:MAG: hypothetical protein Edafosvirus7_31 [Edafosvirus sp.]|uniref:Uncharacterized protein n=1 Tax=Edafosvirus sp. TaxID=2487765 RepID=A0A3G4ZXX3_9VIRU|nr:MAG: hypothetical protein Edafosvirus7_31 [Edafosvirus sp.]